MAAGSSGVDLGDAAGDRTGGRAPRPGADTWATAGPGPGRIAGGNAVALRAAALPSVLAGLNERLQDIVDEGTPDNTKRAYASDLRYVLAWALASGHVAALPLPAEVVAHFLADHVDGGLPADVDLELVRMGVKRKVGMPAISTVERRLAALSIAHKLGGHPNPCADGRVQQILSRARKRAMMKGWKPRKRAAAHMEVLEELLLTCGDDLAGVRDRALLLFAFASGGRRRSEISSAEYDRLERMGDDYVYNLGLTKTDKSSEAGHVPVAGRAAKAMEAWLRRSDVDSGALFRGVDRWGNLSPDGIAPQTVLDIVRRRARLAGLDHSRFGAHSLRSGFMTETGLQGISLGEAMALSRHKSVEVALGYHQAGAGLNNKAARVLG